VESRAFRDATLMSDFQIA